jgi:hypothetical protein
MLEDTFEKVAVPLALAVDQVHTQVLLTATKDVPKLDKKATRQNNLKQKLFFFNFIHFSLCLEYS